MTFRLPLWIGWVFLTLGLLLLTGLLAGGVAWVVADARADRIGETLGLLCTDDALRVHTDESDELREQRPEPPDYPLLDSDRVWDTYQRDFRDYQREFERWIDDGDQVSEKYSEAIRECLAAVEY